MKVRNALSVFGKTIKEDIEIEIKLNEKFKEVVNSGWARL